MENFVVSARKYRPQTFHSVVGQRHITTTLKNAIERGQLAHAYLFCGPRGVGKTTCARIFAKAINCLNPQGGEACNECESCRSFNEGRSLNVHELDAASNNSVEDIRNLIEQVRIIPQVGKYSVFVIDEVHMLSAAAFNAFLKTLEEPPHHAIFILATTEKHKIIPTILSRCQIYDFNRIKVEDGVEYLRHIASQEGVTADDEALNLIAHKADGGMRDALSMFDKAVSFCGTTLNYKDVASTLNVLDYDTYFTMTDMLLGGDYVNALIAFDGVLAKGFSPQVFIAGLNAHMRDLLMSKGPAFSLVEFTGTLVERYKEQASRCSEAMLFNAIALLTEADGKIRQSSNQRLLVELGLMKIAGLGQKKNDLIDSPTFETAIALPELSQAAPSVATPSVTPSAAPVVSEPRVTPQPQAPQPAPQSQAPAPQSVAAERANTAGGQESAPTRRRTTSGRGSSTSISLNALIGGGAKTATELAEEAVAATEVHIDPQSESKLRAIKSSFVQNLMVKRPRFGVIFNTMEVEGNVVVVTVASQETANELLQNRTEWLNDIASAAGVDGTLDLRVVVNEEVRTARPITLEDRLKHLVAKNDKLKDMIEALALDAE
jgi:DNA polymerase-3 subunit gamma/tau